MLHTLAIGMPGPFEMIIIAGISLLIFGKRLPDVGKNLALGIRGFQKGLKSTGDEGDDTADANDRNLPDKR